MSDTTLAKQITQAVEDFSDWTGCDCSECKADARSHAVDTDASMKRLAAELRVVVRDTTDRLREAEQAISAVQAGDAAADLASLYFTKYPPLTD